MDKPSFHLESFEGPLELLLFLISKHKLNIYDIPISELLRQYLEYIDRWQETELDPGMEIASEFLEMAARLLHMKTLMLLPRPEEAEKLQRELTGQLIEYQTCREIAARLGEQTAGFGAMTRRPLEIEPDQTYGFRHEPFELTGAYLDAAGRGLRRLPPPAALFTPLVAKPVVSVSTKIVFVLRQLKKGTKLVFSSLFSRGATRSDAVATFLALLELIKADRVMVRGSDLNAKITLKGNAKFES